MKKLLVVLMTVALFAFPVSGFCLDLSEMTFGVNGGLMLPQGDLDDIGLDMGFVIGGQAMMPSGVMDELTVGLCVTAGMASGDYEESGWGYSVEGDIDFKMFEILPTARFTLPLDAGDIQVFGQAGVGFAWGEVEVDIDNYGSESDDDTEFGFAFGGGATFMENFEAVALYKKFDDIEYITLTIGYNFPN